MTAWVVAVFSSVENSFSRKLVMKRHPMSFPKKGFRCRLSIKT